MKFKWCQRKKRWGKIINRLEGERPISFKWTWGLMRSSESCFGNQIAGKVTENKNSQRQLTFLPHSTRQGAWWGTWWGSRKTRAPTFRPHTLIPVFSCWTLRQEEMWGTAQEQTQPSHSQPPPGTKGFSLHESSKEESFRWKYSLILTHTIECLPGIHSHKGNV